MKKAINPATSAGYALGAFWSQASGKFDGHRFDEVEARSNQRRKTSSEPRHAGTEPRIVSGIEQ